MCDGRVALITGGGRGLGRAHALALAAEGAAVMVNDLGGESDGRGASLTPAQEVAAEIEAMGGTAVVDGSDVSDFDAAEAMVRSCVERLGRLDVVVNNAGILRDRMFVNTSAEEWDDVIRVHLRGHFCVARHAAAHWRDQVKAGDAVDARIINTTSGAGLLGSIGQSAYAAAKAAIAALTIMQAAELGRYGITANALAPSARTRLTEGVFTDMMAEVDSGFDAMDPANISPLVVWLSSAESAHVTGRVFELEGGVIGLFDGWQFGPRVDKGDRWEPSEVGAAVDRLISDAPLPGPVYGA
ncbi:MAG: SDR family NAD(P)-dependent oxidoreductase [Acidimicrobiales bacterium]|nr:SDR family NAD(P)-dependent oxidoreductase [Acidimicrobiales bacterium]